MAATLKRLWKKEWFQTVVSIVVIIAIIAGLFFGSKIILNTDYPVLTVESGSMCIPYGVSCDGWTHPFDRTLHVGDVIFVQGVNPAELNTNYPNSDIIVFHRPGDPSELIVHRIVSVSETNGTLYFKTKGDGNSMQDLWTVSQDQIVGKVVGRVPWIGHITLFVKGNSFALPIIIVIIALIVIVEFILPSPKKQKKEQVEKNKLAQMYL